jgi:uncharacterized protein YbaR (Trm112 family)
MDVDPKLWKSWSVRLTKSRLIYNRERQELISKKAGLAYPVRDGIPVMLPDEARQLVGKRAGMSADRRLGRRSCDLILARMC